MDKDLVPEFVYDDAYRKKHKVPTADSNTKYFSGWRICGIPAVNDALKGCQSKSDVIVSDFCHAKGRGEGVYGFSTRKDPNHRLVGALGYGLKFRRALCPEPNFRLVF